MTARRALVVTFVLLLASTACSGSSNKGASDPSGAEDPGTVNEPALGPAGLAVTPGRGGAVQNVQFWYQGDTVNAVKKFGRVASVVVTAKARESEKKVVDAIHSIGAKAYRYVQAYWYPVGQRVGGQVVSDHLDWVYCKEGDEPLVGRTVDGVKWYVMDNNERSWRDTMRQEFARIKALGWDGVMFDRGFAALTGEDPERLDIWHRPSTCTQNAVVPGAPAADAFVGIMGDVEASGLELMQNYGISVFDPIMPFRPDPTDPACRAGDSPNCKFTRAGMEGASSFVDEAASHNRDELFVNDFMANQANEKDAEFGGRVVTLVTAGTLGGDVSRANVYFQWNRIKLFSVPVGVFMGDDKCAGRSGAGVCNRFGVYKELNDADLGAPVADGPESTNCVAGSTVNCVWYRRYANGASVVNVTDAPQTVTLPLAYGRCARVKDLESEADLGRCADTVPITLAPWSGHPLVFTP